MPEIENNEVTEEETVETPETEPETGEPEEEEHHPTPEEEEEWERERQAEWDAKMLPMKTLHEAVAEHDDLLADTLYELTLLELGMEE